MAFTAPRAGDLREVLRFERRAPKSDDGYGNREDAFATLIRRRSAAVKPTLGGEQVIAARLSGKGSFDIWIRSDSETRTLTVGDRAVDIRNPDRVFNIRWVEDPFGRREWLLIQAERGVAS